MAKGPFSICFIDRDALSFFSGGAVSKLKFDPAVVRDIDVVNKDTFRKQIMAFVDSQKINPSNFMIVFAEGICFSIDIAAKTSEEEKKALIQNFRNSVPFEHVEAKVFATSTGERLICINKDLYETILQGFDARGFNCLDVYPDWVIGNFGTKGLTPAIAKSMAENIGKDNINGFFGDVVIESETQVVSEETFFNKNKRMILLSSIFGALLIILLIFVLTR